MAKYIPITVSSGYLSTTQHNQNMTDIAEELNDKVLYRDNPTGEANQMESTLDMNSNQILNLLDGVNAQEPATVGQLQGAVIETDIPAQAGHRNKALHTDGSVLSWRETVQVFNTVAIMTASTLDFATGEYVFVKGRTTLGDNGGGLFRYVEGAAAGTYTTDGGSIFRPDGGDGSAAWIRDTETFTSTMFAGDESAAAEAALLVGKPLVLFDGEVAKIVCDPTSGDDIQAMAGWVGACHVPAGATLYMELADGVHTVSTYIDIIGPGPIVDIRATSAPEEIQITDVGYASVSGTVYSADITIDSPLPTRAVVGSPIGIQQGQGDQDAASMSGGQIIQSIAGDRLSFIVHIDSPNGAPSNPAALDNTLIWSLPANKCLIPRGSIIAQATGWDGGAREGFINMLNGGRCNIRYVGIAYSGTRGTEHDLILARDTGSRFYAYDKVVLAGAGDKVLRQYGGSEMFINRSCIGGAGYAQEIIQLTAGAIVQFVRTSCGGASTGCITIGEGCFANFAQAPLVSSGYGVKLVGPGSRTSVYPALVSNHTRGIYTVAGTAYVTNTLNIEGCGTGVDWLASGFTTGDITFGTGSQVNTTDSASAANTLYRGGGWYKDITRGLTDAGERVNIADNGVATTTLSGTGGCIKVCCETLPQLGFELDIDIVSPATIYIARYAGTEIVQDTVDLTGVGLPYNTGKVTISVYLDGSDYKLSILNEDGGGRAFSVYAQGEIQFSDFA